LRFREELREEQMRKAEKQRSKNLDSSTGFGHGGAVILTGF
jgi:hypothetical protein